VDPELEHLRGNFAHHVERNFKYREGEIFPLKIKQV